MQSFCLFTCICGLYFLSTGLSRVRITKMIRSAATIVDPTGVPWMIAVTMPASAPRTEMTAEHMDTFRKLRHTCIAEIAGKMIRAEISSEPTRFIASTMITAITTAIIVL